MGKLVPKAHVVTISMPHKLFQLLEIYRNERAETRTEAIVNILRERFIHLTYINISKKKFDAIKDPPDLLETGIGSVPPPQQDILESAKNKLSANICEHGDFLGHCSLGCK